MSKEWIDKDSLQKILEKHIQNLRSELINANRAWEVCKAIGDNKAELKKYGLEKLFGFYQYSARTLLFGALSKIFDTYPRGKDIAQAFQTSCLISIRMLIEEYRDKLNPKNYDKLKKDTLQLIKRVSVDENMNMNDFVINHLKSIRDNEKTKQLLRNLKSIRNKKLAHNDIIDFKVVPSLNTKDMKSLFKTVRETINIIGDIYNCGSCPRDTYSLSMNIKNLLKRLKKSRKSEV